MTTPHPTDSPAGSSPVLNSPRNSLTSSARTVVGVNDTVAQSPVLPSMSAAAPPATHSSTGLPFDEEVKLVYGVIFSLRNMIKKISGRWHPSSTSPFIHSNFLDRDEQFVNYRTSAYKLHLYETPSGYKFVMFSDPSTESLRFVLRQIYVGPFLEYVVRNPLVKMDSRENGIDNEYFRSSVDRLVRGLSVFS